MGESWRTLDQTQKKKYDDLRAKDIERYKNECEHLKKYGYFINSKGENSKDNFKPTFGDEIVQPSKPKSAYIFYYMSNQKALSQENPDL